VLSSKFGKFLERIFTGTVISRCLEKFSENRNFSL